MWSLLVLALGGTLALSIPLGKRQDGDGFDFSNAFTPSDSTFDASNSASFSASLPLDLNTPELSAGPAPDPSIFSPESNQPLVAATLPDLNLNQITALTPAPVDPVPVAAAPVNPVPVAAAPVNPVPVAAAPVNPVPVATAPVNPVPVGPDAAAGSPGSAATGAASGTLVASSNLDHIDLPKPGTGGAGNTPSGESQDNPKPIADGSQSGTSKPDGSTGGESKPFSAPLDLQQSSVQDSSSGNLAEAFTSDTSSSDQTTYSTVKPPDVELGDPDYFTKLAEKLKGASDEQIASRIKEDVHNDPQLAYRIAGTPGDSSISRGQGSSGPKLSAQLEAAVASLGVSYLKAQMQPNPYTQQAKAQERLYELQSKNQLAAQITADQYKRGVALENAKAQKELQTQQFKLQIDLLTKQLDQQTALLQQQRLTAQAQTEAKLKQAQIAAAILDRQKALVESQQGYERYIASLQQAGDGTSTNGPQGKSTGKSTTSPKTPSPNDGTSTNGPQGKSTGKDTQSTKTPSPDTPSPKVGTSTDGPGKSTGQGTSSPDTPSANTPSANTPSPDTPQPNTPSANTPSPDTPQPNTPSANTPSPDTPQPNTPSTADAAIQQTEANIANIQSKKSTVEAQKQLIDGLSPEAYLLAQQNQAAAAATAGTSATTPQTPADPQAATLQSQTPDPSLVQQQTQDPSDPGTVYQNTATVRYCNRDCLLPATAFMNSMAISNECSQQSCPLGNPPDASVIYRNEGSTMNNLRVEWAAIPSQFRGSDISSCPGNGRVVELCATASQTPLIATYAPTD